MLPGGPRRSSLAARRRNHAVRRDEASGRAWVRGEYRLRRSRRLPVVRTSESALSRAAARYQLRPHGTSILAAINYVESTFDQSYLPGASTRAPTTRGRRGRCSSSPVAYRGGEHARRPGWPAAERLRRGRRGLQQRALSARSRDDRQSLPLAGRDLRPQPLAHLRPASSRARELLPHAGSRHAQRRRLGPAGPQSSEPGHPPAQG